jgi:hypothetical protein
MSEGTFELTPKGLLYDAGWDDRVINEAVGELTRYCMQHGCGLAIVDGQLRFVTLTREPAREDGVDRSDCVDAGAVKAPPVPEDGVLAMMRMPIPLGDLVKLGTAIQGLYGDSVKMRQELQGWLSFVKEGGR